MSAPSVDPCVAACLIITVSGTPLVIAPVIAPWAEPYDADSIEAIDLHHMKVSGLASSSTTIPKAEARQNREQKLLPLEQLHLQ